ncbi:MAG: lytic transglycosylase domain-containing protein [Myxococcota bacterium]
MKPVKSRRPLLMRLGLVLLTGAAVTPALPAEAEPTPVEAPAENASAAFALEGPAAGDEGLPTFAPGSSVEPLQGRPGAATALIARDPETALRLLDAEPSTVAGSREWFVHSALRGRAMRMRGQPGEAVAVLEPLTTHDDLEALFPPDVVGYELAQARVEWARQGSLDTEQADAQREQAVRELSKLRRIKSLRNGAELRVLQGEAMAEIEGSSERSTARAASKAAGAMTKLVLDYPNHPRIGELRLALARAQVRAGSVTEAADTLRRITIERAGEPESDVAWAELSALASANSKVKQRSLSVGERLEQAVYARGLRRVETSRRILDELIADPDLSSSRRRQAQRSRSYTAYKQRDYQTCVDDLRPMYDSGINGDVRDWLLRCYERGEMYEPALAIWEKRVDDDRSSTRANGLWNGLQLAVRAGRYVQADRWLEAYERDHKGHRSERDWLRPWIAYRLGRDGEAIDGFRELADGRSRDATRARYFLGKLLLQGPTEEHRTEGTSLLQQLAAGGAWTYYGLIARQRLLDAGVETPPLPELPAVADEARRPGREDTERHLEAADLRFGEAWPTIRRTRQLYEAGYIEEARRELRHAARAFTDVKKGRSPGPRSEALFVGLGWKAEWEYPRTRATSAGRKTMRNAEESEALQRSLRTLAHDLSEPHAWARLSTSADGPYKARWHPRAYRGPVEREARLRGLDPIHMWSLMYTESRFRRHVVSPVGARGALQIMPWTARQLAQRIDEMPADGRFNSDALFDIDTNAHLSAVYVSELLKKFHGQAPMAYASYNGGPSNVGRWLRAKSGEGATLELDTFVEEIAFEESYRYTKRVTEVSAAYSMLYTGTLPRWSNEVDPIVEDNIAF